jgi:hypothetical protein
MRHSLCVLKSLVFLRFPCGIHGCSVALLVITDAQAAEGVLVRFDFLAPPATQQEGTANERLVTKF